MSTEKILHDAIRQLYTDDETIKNLRVTVSTMREAIIDRVAERDALLAALVPFVEQYVGSSGIYEPACVAPQARAAVQRALMAIAKAKNKSTFGNDWMDALAP